MSLLEQNGFSVFVEKNSIVLDGTIRTQKKAWDDFQNLWKTLSKKEKEIYVYGEAEPESFNFYNCL